MRLAGVVENDPSRDATIPLITHLALSPGWPTAMSAPVAKEGFKPRL